MPRRDIRIALALLPVLACLLFSSCSDENCATCPETTGTLMIDQSPDALAAAGWSLAGPRNG